MIQEAKIVDNQMQVILTGSIYVEDARKIKETLSSCIDNGQTSFLINLSQVEYIDGAGLGALVYLQKQALKKGGRVVIKGINGLVKDIFELTRLTKVFEIQ